MWQLKKRWGQVENRELRRRTGLRQWSFVCFALMWAACLNAQDSGAIVGKQIKELQVLSKMDGKWRGSAWIILPTGERQEMTQTERIGPLLGGAIKLVEGRGYDAAGKTVFNAFAVISYDATLGGFSMRSYAQGRVGDFPMQITNDGYTWEIKSGPMTIRYTAEIKDGRWFEYGERLAGDRNPTRFFEMSLQRIGDSAWPAEEPVALE